MSVCRHSNLRVYLQKIGIFLNTHRLLTLLSLHSYLNHLKCLNLLLLLLFLNNFLRNNFLLNSLNTTLVTIQILQVLPAMFVRRMNNLASTVPTAHGKEVVA